MCREVANGFGIKDNVVIHLCTGGTYLLFIRAHLKAAGSAGPAFASLSLAESKMTTHCPLMLCLHICFLLWIGAEYTRYLMPGCAITNGGSQAHIEHSWVELTVEGESALTDDSDGLWNNSGSQATPERGMSVQLKEDIITYEFFTFSSPFQIENVL